MFGFRTLNKKDKIKQAPRGNTTAVQLIFVFIFIFILFRLTYSITDGPHSILPEVIKDLPISPRFTPYNSSIAMLVQHSYNSSING